ncbi:MAG: hypothetical protein WCL34_13885 [Methylococcaceae bacterium]
MKLQDLYLLESVEDEYTISNPSKRSYAIFRNLFNNNWDKLKSLARQHRFNQIIDLLNKSIKKQLRLSHLKRKIEFSLSDKSEWDKDPRTTIEAAGLSEPKGNSPIFIRVNKAFADALANNDKPKILHDFRNIMLHEFTHVSQWRRHASSMDEVRQPQWWDKLTELAKQESGDEKVDPSIYSGQLLVDPNTEFKTPGLKDALLHAYFLNKSEFPAHAQTAMLELLSTMQRGNIHRSGQNWKEIMMKYVLQLKQTVADPLKVPSKLKEASQVVNLYSSLLQDMPDIWQKFLDLMQQWTESMSANDFELP